MNRVKLDISGKRFGRLTALKLAYKKARTDSKHYEHFWLCKCDCGGLTIVRKGSLLAGNTISCGCYMREIRTIARKTHCKSNTRLYRVWAGIKTRCFNPKHKHYKYYGGRGITICDEWKNDFQSFYNWALSNGYDENASRNKCTIDRIDGNGNYTPSNCRWVDMKTQIKNRIMHKNKVA